jgi:hypothetical protein
MKKVKLKGTLSLNKETVSQLNGNDMEIVKAGGAYSRGICFRSRLIKCSDRLSDRTPCGDF